MCSITSPTSRQFALLLFRRGVTVYNSVPRDYLRLDHVTFWNSMSIPSRFRLTLVIRGYKLKCRGELNN